MYQTKTVLIMKEEDKELLLSDLCARLPYCIKCKILENNEIKIISSIQYDGVNTLFDFWEDEQKIQYGYQLYLSEFKPLLFPLSSMTEEQREEWYQYCFENKNKTIGTNVDWLNKNHFDFRGLIEKGLAIDCTNLNIY